jgi:hypothetical protein
MTSDGSQRFGKLGQFLARFKRIHTRSRVVELISFAQIRKPIWCHFSINGDFSKIRW